MTRYDAQRRYFEWLVNLVCNNRYSRDISYRKLLSYLHNTEFVFSIPMDENRIGDGLDLRWQFVCDQYNCDRHCEIREYLTGPCSVFEMMVALTIRCESIMDDTSYGDRTDQWFWGMISSLGLGSMNDSRFDLDYVEDCVIRFLERDYEPDGRGGLFTIRHCDRDLRDVEIWTQLCLYLDSIH